MLGFKLIAECGGDGTAEAGGDGTAEAGCEELATESLSSMLGRGKGGIPPLGMPQRLWRLPQNRFQNAFQHLLFKLNRKPIAPKTGQAQFNPRFDLWPRGLGVVRRSLALRGGYAGRDIGRQVRGRGFSTTRPALVWPWQTGFGDTRRGQGIRSRGHSRENGV